MEEYKQHLKKLNMAKHHDPFEFLGQHPDGKGGTVIRAFLPEAIEARLVVKGREYPMARRSKTPLFEGSLKAEGAYRIRAIYEGGEQTFHDPYSFPPVLTDFDLHLIAEGTHYRKYEKLGAHLTRINKVDGVHFSVWAPNAEGVSVVGDFNNWDGRRNQMRLRGSTGVWEIFIPEVAEGAMYKFELRTSTGVMLKTDPYGFYAEIRPETASIVWSMDKYQWSDSGWMEQRDKRDWLSEPISIYEAHLGSWMRGGQGETLSYRELAHNMVEYVTRMGYTHIQLLPVQEHPYDGSWGYQVLGYFAVTSRFGTPEDFMYFVDHCHENGIGVLLDWVPAHFPKDAHGLAHFDGTFLYEHEHEFMREHQDWGTLIFNYGRNEVASFLLNSALFWLDMYHIDGLRVDAVASMLYLDYSREDGQWIPNKYGGNENLEAITFIKRFNELCHEKHPGVLTIAEESTAWPMVSRPTYSGGLGFSLKWNMGWMHDTLEYFGQDPVHRKYHHHSLSFGLIYAFHENFILVLSHDEVVHGKGSMLDRMPGDLWQKFANLRLLYGFMYAHPGKKLMFMGCEFGQWIEWDHSKSLDWHLLDYEHHEKLQLFVRDLNLLIKREPSLHEADFTPEGFEWIDHSDAETGVISFIRRAKDPSDYLVFALNMTPVPRHGYRVGVPEQTVYKEIFNSDSSLYGGSNMGNGGLAVADAAAYNQFGSSLNLTLPPLAILVLKPVREG
ncbi:1,4-alpha-glucan branching protein GlgB [Nitrospirota bacterium]